MTDTQDTTRSIGQRIEIDAPPEAVWEAVATGDGVARWFGFAARVDGAEGGDYFVSWGPDCEGTWKIASWDPPRHLVLRDESFVPGLPQTVDYTVEGDAGRTVLRLTHSGIGADAKWDEMYDSMSRGWEVFVRTLRHSVERHPGLDRVVARARKSIDAAREEVWARLIGPDGLALSRDERSGSYAFTREHNLAGDLWVWNPPKDLAGTVGSLNDAALWVALEKSGETVHLDMTLSAFGVAEAPVRAVERRWQAMLDHLFPSTNGS